MDESNSADISKSMGPPPLPVENKSSKDWWKQPLSIYQEHQPSPVAWSPKQRICLDHREGFLIYNSCSPKFYFENQSQKETRTVQKDEPTTDPSVLAKRYWCGLHTLLPFVSPFKISPDSSQLENAIFYLVATLGLSEWNGPPGIDKTYLRGVSGILKSHEGTETLQFAQAQLLLSLVFWTQGRSRDSMNIFHSAVQLVLKLIQQRGHPGYFEVNIKKLSVEEDQLLVVFWCCVVLESEFPYKHACPTLFQYESAVPFPINCSPSFLDLLIFRRALRSVYGLTITDGYHAVHAQLHHIELHFRPIEQKNHSDMAWTWCKESYHRARYSLLESVLYKIVIKRDDKNIEVMLPWVVDAIGALLRSSEVKFYGIGKEAAALRQYQIAMTLIAILKCDVIRDQVKAHFDLQLDMFIQTTIKRLRVNAPSSANHLFLLYKQSVG